PAYLGRLTEYYRPLKSSLHADSQLRLERNPLRLLDSKVAQDQPFKAGAPKITDYLRSEEHTSELQSHLNLVCRLLLEKKKIKPAGPVFDVGRADLSHPKVVRTLGSPAEVNRHQNLRIVRHVTKQVDSEVPVSLRHASR